MYHHSVQRSALDAQGFVGHNWVLLDLSGEILYAYRTEQEARAVALRNPGVVHRIGYVRDYA